MGSSKAWPFLPPTDDGAVRHLKPGHLLPDVTLASTRGPFVNLSRLKGRSAVFVYPWTGRPGIANPPRWDDIPGAHGSTPQAEGYAARYLEFEALGVSIFGLSLQDSAEQAEFARRLNLPFVLLSDSAKEMQARLGLPIFTTGRVDYLVRVTLLIRDGRIENTVYPVHPPPCDAETLIKRIQRL